MKNKFLGMIGMAMRAGKVQTGEDISSKCIKSGKSKLIILTKDASGNTKKSITNSCDYYKVKSIECLDMMELGKSVGKDARAVISINDDNFAKAILDRYDKSVFERVM